MQERGREMDALLSASVHNSGKVSYTAKARLITQPRGTGQNIIIAS